MPLRDDAITLAFATYNGSLLLQMSRVEWGHVLYEQPAGQVLAGDRVTSPDNNAVNLYDVTVNLRVLGADPTFNGTYLGDYHTHPVGNSWMSQFPSPDDLAHPESVSVINDLWQNGLGNLLYEAPKLQLVQSLLFGDLFVLDPVRARARFTTFDAQDASLRAIYAAFDAAHGQGHDVHGAIPDARTPAQFDLIVQAVLPTLVATLNGRATITFVPNATGPARQGPRGV